MAVTYYVGAAIRATVVFENLAGTATDTTIAWRTVDAVGTVTNYAAAAPEVAHTTTGTYTLDVTLPAVPGPFRVVAIGTGTVEQSAVVNITVTDRPGD